LIVFFIAVFIRINEYGITINRYVILLLGIWLTIVCIYTAIGKTNIKFIPTSLAVLMLLVSFGPWGMFSVSEKSQVNRLKSILEKSNILLDNKVQNEPIWIKDSLPELFNQVDLTNDNKLTDSLHNEVISILDYLDNHHGFSMIREWYKQDIDSLISTSIVKNKEDVRYYNEARIYMKSLGLNYEYVEVEENVPNLEFVSIRDNLLKNVSGYDYVINFDYYSSEEKEYEISSFKLDSIEYQLIISYNSKVNLTLKSKSEIINFKMNEFVIDIKNKFNNNSNDHVPISSMMLMDSCKKLHIKIEFQNLELQNNKKENYIERVSGDVFIKKK
jgi:hypothetical protein